MSMKNKRLLLILLPCLIIAPPLVAQQTDEHRIGLLNSEIYEVDASHSMMKFRVSFMGLTDVEGTFDDFNAVIFYNESDLETLRVILRINAASIDTGSDFRDKDLRSERFFDAENYPEIVFKSTSVESSDEGYTVNGKLTIKGIEKNVSIPVSHELNRTTDTAWGNVRIGFTGSARLNRYDYNVTGGDNWGTNMISDEVQISFSILGRIFNMNRIAYRSREKTSIGAVLEEKIKNEGIEKALDYYQSVSDTRPDSLNISARELYVLTHRLKQNGQLEYASKTGKVYAQSYPDSPDAMATMAELFAMQGDRDEAVRYYNKVLELNPEDKSLIDIANLALQRLQ